jgi:ADP-ribosylglycohydrolase
MHYSLRSRFRGAIIGLAIGARQQKFGSYQPQLSYRDANLERSLEKQSFSPESSEEIVTVVEAGMKSLIERRQFDVEDWHHGVGKNSSLSALEAIIATIPLALFYHENEIKLRQNLQLAVAAVGQDDSEIRDLTLAVGYAIALSLQPKLHSAKLISKTIDFVGNTESKVAQNLSKVKIFLEQNAGLETVVTNLERSERPSSCFALAFYCYLSTLEDFRLSLGRVVEKSSEPQLTCAITAALSGAYNGLAGIPATLRQQLRCPSLGTGCASMTTEEEMLRLCDALVAVWSGVYDRANQPTNLSQVAAIAAPRAIRRR